MKKIPILFLSILMFGLAFGTAKPVSAAISEKGTTWWSVEELLDFYQEVEAEKEDECGDNQDCRMEFGYSMPERGPKYSALNNLMETQIWVTSINPTTETIKVLFFDDEMMLKHMGIEEKLRLEHLYVGWMEDWSGQIYNYNHEQFTNGEILGVHTVYDSTNDDISKIIPWTETELSATGSNLSDNISGKLDYAVFAEDNMFNAQGYFNYSSCLNAEDYEYGMECKMYVSGNQWVSYFPPREQIEEQTEQNEYPEANQIEEPVQQNDYSEENQIDNPEQDGQAENVSKSADSINYPAQPIIATNSTITAPHTGDNTKGNEYSVEMPWWIVVLEFLGISLMIWWFIPNRNKKAQKNLKKHKKTIDKKQYLR